MALPYPTASGRWSEPGFLARFRPDSGGRRHIQHFRRWLAEESGLTRRWLEETAGV